MALGPIEGRRIKLNISEEHCTTSKLKRSEAEFVEIKAMINSNEFSAHSPYSETT